MLAIAVAVRTTPRCVMTINKLDQRTLTKRASQHVEVEELISEGKRSLFG